MSFTLKPGMKIVLAAVITAGAGTAAYAVYAVNADHQTVTVPDFSGKARRIVEIWAKKNNLTDQIKFEEEYSDDVLTDCVISQSAR
ncbi:MAG: PASTA domain-containing protein [Lactimicrobium massiliense]|nr:PASTA domain-containing protein [Lactimicrobium massiliense]MDD6726117.1 PASTA domain-containing protein [Lactimicrobium massiliense]